jgi:hypothetical protein
VDHVTRSVADQDRQKIDENWTNKRCKYLSFGIQPVAMNMAVMSPQAMKAPRFGTTIEAIKPPYLWIFSIMISP